MQYWAIIKKLFLRAVAQYLVDHEGLKFQLLQLQAVRIQPGDVVVVKSERPLSAEQGMRVKQYLQQCSAFETHEIIVLDAGLSLSVVRPDRSKEPKQAKEYYALLRPEEVYINTAKRFADRGGLSSEWGKDWEKIHANSIAEARAIATTLRDKRRPVTIETFDGQKSKVNTEQAEQGQE